MNKQIPEPPKVYTYELPGGWTVMVGKTDRDNDRLSIKLAHPRDWWFHVHGMPGSHVLLKAKENDEEPRSGGTVPVSCTRARYVTKPRGAKPGTVNIRKERIIKVRPEPVGLKPALAASSERNSDVSGKSSRKTIKHT
ncbi:MAG: hypothetical protein JRJ86_02525 [Deltaproteobacteria bacterium]|nr:hypothetical protein [Deltaproteobacteria bacterium]